MKSDYDQDEKLVNFLKEYKPIPNTIKLKENQTQLMMAIKDQSRDLSYLKMSKMWAIPSIVTAGFILIFSQINKHNWAFQTAEKQDTIESFMVNSWDELMIEKDQKNSTYFIQDDWVNLTEQKELIFITSP